MIEINSHFLAFDNKVWAIFLVNSSVFNGGEYFTSSRG